MLCSSVNVFIYRSSHSPKISERLHKIQHKGIAKALIQIANVPFERRNNSIIAYTFQSCKLIAVYYIKNKATERRINLFRLVDGSEGHYSLIKIFSKLIQRLTRSATNRRHDPSQITVQTALNRYNEQTTENSSRLKSQIGFWKFAIPFPLQ